MAPGKVSDTNLTVKDEAEDASCTYRFENDSFGQVAIPASKYWGAQTQRATTVFTVGSITFPTSLIRAFALQKTAACRANERLGCLDNTIANVVVEAALDLRRGLFDDHFPLPVWQTGSGTQTNMNVNEVIANRANELLAIQETGKVVDTELLPQLPAALGSRHPVHPNDHVNCSQSSNDTFPTVMHITTLLEMRDSLIPSLQEFETVLREKSIEFDHIIKIGRTHLMDAVPMRLGQTFNTFAWQMKHHIDRAFDSLQRLAELPQGGTAVGSGLNAPPRFDELFCEELNQLTGPLQPTEKQNEQNGHHQVGHNLCFVPARSKFESMGSHDALLEVSSVLTGIATSILKMATDLRFLSSGPRCGLGELIAPHDGLTSSIMPGKQNPTIAEMISQIAFQVMGNHSAVSAACAAGGHFELNVANPVIIHNILQSISLLAEGIPVFAHQFVQELAANEKTLKKNLDSSLLVATTLNTHIGYDKVSKIVKMAMKEDMEPREAAVKLGYLTSADYDAIIAADCIDKI